MNPRMIDANYLIAEFTDRARAARNWKESALNSGNEEAAIRADATLAFLTEVKLTIDNAPTVEITEEQAIDKLHETGWMQRHDKEMTERPTGNPVIKCKDCKYQEKEWREDRRMKEKGYWSYGCKYFGELMGYWGFGGNDNEFCSEAEQRDEQEVEK